MNPNMKQYTRAVLERLRQEHTAQMKTARDLAGWSADRKFDVRKRAELASVSLEYQHAADAIRIIARQLLADFAEA